MDPVFAFLAAIILVSLIIPKMGPFLSLVIAAILFGLMVGMGQELIGFIATGLGRIFSNLAIVVFCGALLAEYLRRTEAIERIVADLGGLARQSLLVSGAAGYLVSVPVMCSITAYMILEPVVSGLGKAEDGANKRALFMTAVCSVISFNFIYPSPVMTSLSDSLGIKPYDLLIRTIPISLILFTLAYVIMLRLPVKKEKPIAVPIAKIMPKISRARAWAPLALPLVLILQGSFSEKTTILADPGIALLIGAMLGLALARDLIHELIHTASRRSGVILLDLCGAGAFGYVVAQSNLGLEIFRLGQFLPLLILPFLISAVLQLAQGSRVVTAVVAAQILAYYPLDGETVALLIAAGAFMFSYVSDPYFWLIKNSTGASLRETALGYTLPLSFLGLVAYGLAVVSSIL
jgi:GntP family gluconate:H+ symporter